MSRQAIALSWFCEWRIDWFLLADIAGEDRWCFRCCCTARGCADREVDLHMLAGAYGRFSEGFAAGDLSCAKALLDARRLREYARVKSVLVIGNPALKGREQMAAFRRLDSGPGRPS